MDNQRIRVIHGENSIKFSLDIEVYEIVDRQFIWELNAAKAGLGNAMDKRKAQGRKTPSYEELTWRLHIAKVERDLAVVKESCSHEALQGTVEFELPIGGLIAA
jgi:hypothetical protein